MLLKQLITYILCFCSFIQEAASQVSLVANPLPEGQLCPGAITFTCVSRLELPTIRWFITDEEGEDQVALFSHNRNTVYPQNVPTDTPGVTITMTSAISSGNTDNVNFTSTLETSLGNLWTLHVTAVSCGTLATKAVIATNFTLTGPPATSSIPCSITAHQGRGCYEMPVSQTFITDHAVGEYEIEISPDPMSTLCASGTVEANTTYVCSGLEIGTLYNFTLTASNCDGQEGPTEMFSIHPQVPVSPKLSTLVATYGPANKSNIWEEDAINTTLTSISMTWEEDVSSTLITERCVCDEAISYTVDVSDGLGTIASNVSLPHCNQNTCSAYILIEHLPLRESYLVRIYARNIFGTSSHYYSSAVASSSDTILKHSLKTENCTTYVMCTAPNTSLLAANNCTIKFGTDPSYSEDNSSITGPVSVWFELPLLQPSTDYYHQASVTLISGTIIVVRGVFTTKGTTSFGTTRKLQTTSNLEIFTTSSNEIHPPGNSLIITVATGLSTVAAIVLCIFITAITVVLTCSRRYGKKKLETSAHVPTTNSSYSRVTDLSLPVMNNVTNGNSGPDANLQEDVSDNRTERGGEDYSTYDEIGTSEVSRVTSLSQDAHLLREVRTEPHHHTSQDLYSHLNHKVNETKGCQPSSQNSFREDLYSKLNHKVNGCQPSSQNTFCEDLYSQLNHKVNGCQPSSQVYPTAHSNTDIKCNQGDTTRTDIYAQVDKSRKKSTQNSAESTDAPELLKRSKELGEYITEEYLSGAPEVPKRSAKSVKDAEYAVVDTTRAPEVPRRSAKSVKDAEYAVVDTTGAPEVPKRSTKSLKDAEYAVVDTTGAPEVPKRSAKSVKDAEYAKLETIGAPEVPKRSAKSVEDAEYAVVGTTGAPEVPKKSKALYEYLKVENSNASH